jgi:signal transduction histidine kinase
VFEVSEEERQRLSRELHDRVGQPLAALRINLDVLRSRLPAEATPQLDKQAALIEELIRLVRTLTAELRPPELEQIGLAAALRNYGEAAAARYGFAVDVLGAEFAPRLPRAAERALFRIAQEALANAAKHAKAETVTIELEDEAREAIVSVADDGRGFDAARKAGGFGLHAMRERVEEVGGRLEVESAEGLGTRIRAAVPRNR